MTIEEMRIDIQKTLGIYQKPYDKTKSRTCKWCGVFSKQKGHVLGGYHNACFKEKQSFNKSFKERYGHNI